MSDLIQSLRELAAAKHSDLSVAADAADEVERLRAEVERLRAVYVLIATESAGIVEGYSIFEDKIVGCYTSYVAADMSGEKIGYVNWRIEEHEIIDDVLVGKGLPR